MHAPDQQETFTASPNRLLCVRRLFLDGKVSGSSLCKNAEIIDVVMIVFDTEGRFVNWCMMNDFPIFVSFDCQVILILRLPVFSMSSDLW